MHQRRQYERSQSPQLMSVIDRYSDQSIGMLVDLSPGGLLIMVDEPISVHRVFQLQIKLPESVNGSDVLEFGAESVWVDSSGQIGVCWVGFQIIDISDHYKSVVEELVEIWSEQETAQQNMRLAV